MSFVDELRKNRKTSSTAFLRFLQNQSPNSVHVFVEGDDDPSFYRNALNRYCKDNHNIHYHECGGKAQVYRTRETIQKREEVPDWAQSMILIYFVDKDLSDILAEDYPNEADIFVTDYYSIENYLVSETMLEIVLTDLFNFYSGEKPDIAAIRQRFHTELQRFYEYVEEIMLWGIYHKRIGSAFSFSDIKLHHFLEIGTDLSLKTIVDTHEWIASLDDMCQIVTDSQFQNQTPELKKIISNREPKHYIRGKFEIWFLVKFLQRLASVLKTDVNISLRYSQGLMGERDIVKTLGPRFHPFPERLHSFLKHNFQRA
jgi:hypothetical protein